MQDSKLDLPPRTRLREPEELERVAEHALLAYEKIRKRIEAVHSRGTFIVIDGSDSSGEVITHPVRASRFTHFFAGSSRVA